MLAMLCLAFHSKPEHISLVCIYNAQPKAFLWHKLKIAGLYIPLASFPNLLALGIFYPDRIPVLLGLLVFTLFFFLCVLLAKYSAYPKEINVAQGLLLGFSFSFPPLLLFTIPYFYKKAIRSLESILA